MNLASGRHIILVLLAVCFSFASFSQDKEGIEEANDLFEAGEYIKAKPLYSSLLSNFPQDPNYNYRFGTCMLFTESDKSAPLVYLEFAVSKEDVDAEAHFFLGRAYHLNYRFDDAIASYEKFKEEANDRLLERLDVVRQVEMAKSGKSLILNLTDIVVLDKKEISEKIFHNSYDLKEFGGKLITIPDDFKSTKDKKVEDRGLVYVNPKSEVVYFSSYGEKGKSGKDIYYKERLPDGEFGDSKLLVGPVNTPYDEDFPFMHPNGKTLYFASKGHNSMGGYDIYRADYDPSSGSWSSPVNLDFAISTPDDDFLLITNQSQDTAYFTSKRESTQGKVTVYRVALNEVPLSIGIVTGVFTGLETQSATINIEDAETGKKIGAVKTDPATGEYVISLRNGGKYNFFVQSEGSDLTHSGLVELPKSDVLKQLDQKMLIYEEAGEELLEIRNLFDEATKVADQSLLAQILKQNAALDVKPLQISVKKPEKTEVRPQVELAGETSGGTKEEAGFTTEQIVADARSESEDLNAQAATLKEQAAIAFDLAEEKSRAATEASDEATRIFTAGGNFDVRAQEKVQQLNKDAVDQAQEASVAFEVATELDKRAKQKTKEAKRAERFATDLEEATASKSTQRSLELLNQLKVFLEEQEEEAETSTSQFAADLIQERLELKRQEVETKEEYLAQLNTERVGMEEDLERLKSDIQKEKKGPVKDEMTFQIGELERDLQENERETKETNYGLENLRTEVAQIEDQTTMVDDLVASIENGKPKDAEELTAMEKQNLADRIQKIKNPDDRPSDVVYHANDEEPAENDEQARMDELKRLQGEEDSDPVERTVTFGEEESGETGEPLVSIEGGGTEEVGATDEPLVSIEGGGTDEVGETDEPLVSIEGGGTEEVGATDEPLVSIEGGGTEEVGATDEPLVSIEGGGTEEVGATDEPLVSIEGGGTEKVGATDEPLVSIEGGGGTEEVGATEEPLVSIEGGGTEEVGVTDEPLVSIDGGGEGEPVPGAIDVESYGLPADTPEEEELLTTDYTAYYEQKLEQQDQIADESKQETFKAEVYENWNQQIEREIQDKRDLMAETSRIKKIQELQDEVETLEAEKTEVIAQLNASESALAAASNGASDGAASSTSDESTPGEGADAVPYETAEASFQEEQAQIEAAEPGTDRNAQLIDLNTRWVEALDEEITTVETASAAATTEEEKAVLDEQLAVLGELQEEKSLELETLAIADGATTDAEGEEPLVNIVPQDGGSSDEPGTEDTQTANNDGIAGSTDSINPETESSIEETGALAEANGAGEESGGNEEATTTSDGQPTETGTELAASDAAGEEGITTPEATQPEVVIVTPEAYAEAKEQYFEELLSVEKAPPLDEDYFGKRMEESKAVDDNFDRAVAVAKTNLVWQKSLEREVKELKEKRRRIANPDERRQAGRVINQTAARSRQKSQEVALNKRLIEDMAIARGELIPPGEVEQPALADAGSTSNNNSSSNTGNQGGSDNSGAAGNSGEATSNIVPSSGSDSGNSGRGNEGAENPESGEPVTSTSNSGSVADSGIGNDDQPVASNGGAGSDQPTSNGQPSDETAATTSTAANPSAGQDQRGTTPAVASQGSELRPAEAAAQIDVELPPPAIPKDYESEYYRDALSKQEAAEADIEALETELEAAKAEASSAKKKAAKAEAETRVKQLENQLTVKETEAQLQGDRSAALELAKNRILERQPGEKRESEKVREEAQRMRTELDAMLEEVAQVRATAEAEKSKKKKQAYQERISATEEQAMLKEQEVLATEQLADEMAQVEREVLGANYIILPEDKITLPTASKTLTQDEKETIESSTEYTTYVRQQEEVARLQRQADALLRNSQKLRAEAGRNRDAAKRMMMQAPEVSDPAERARMVDEADRISKLAELTYTLADSSDQVAKRVLNQAAFKENESARYVVELGPIFSESLLAYDRDYGQMENRKTTAGPTTTGAVADAGTTTRNQGNQSSESGNAGGGASTDSGGANNNSSSSSTENTLADSGADSGNTDSGSTGNQGGTQNQANTSTQQQNTTRRTVEPLPQVVTKPVFRKLPQEVAEYNEQKPIPINQQEPEGVVFKVQVGAFSRPIPADEFKGFSPITGENTSLPGVTRYTAGLFNNVGDATEARDEIRDLGYEDAFVVAYVNGKRVTIAEARSVLRGERSASDYQAPAVAAQTQPIRTQTTPTTQPDVPVSNPTDSRFTAPTVATGPIEINDAGDIQGLYYTVQVGAYSKPVSPSDLFNITPLNSHRSGSGLIRYTSGVYSSVQEAARAKQEIVNIGVPDAFVTAYYRGERISMSEARQLVANEGSSVIASGNSARPTSRPTAQTGGNTGTAAEAPHGIIYRVKIGTYQAEVPVGEASVILEYTGRNMTVDKKGDGTTTYTTGKFANFSAAEALRKEISSKGVANPSIIATRNGQPISVDEAKKIAP